VSHARPGRTMRAAIIEGPSCPSTSVVLSAGFLGNLD
jgi:hypothetical protein